MLKAQEKDKTVPAIKKQTVPAIKSETVEIQAQTVASVDASPADELFFDAQEGKNGLTLVPEDKTATNHTVEIVQLDGTVITRDGMTVVRRK